MLKCPHSNIWTSCHQQQLDVYYHNMILRGKNHVTTAPVFVDSGSVAPEGLKYPRSLYGTYNFT